MFFMIDILVMGFLKYRIGENPVLMIIQNFMNTLMGNRWMSLYFDNFICSDFKGNSVPNYELNEADS